MKIKLNRSLKGNKKDTIIDLSLCSPQDSRYWRRAIKDSEIDKSVSIISDEEFEKMKKNKIKKEKERIKELEEEKEDDSKKDDGIKINKKNNKKVEVEDANSK
ncbi:MAG: hypothetical protein BV456_00970 [Thermoplasmata archaeon M8B2D]|nr:MAG: hypothetical protein BV456_00970 [Thermoplasmata archaeon M8B2D]